MAYQVLARKWRPQDFTSVVGQEPIVTALRNALQEGRVAQAYLFSGIRGVGKTSVARVLAKALNCENGPAGDPCNDCTTCQEITAGADLDVVEVDAATYSKVEQIRELTESLKYGPARDRHKVVVIDEIHRLSRQAFDALLKIVEEPPPHLLFIFATTEAEAVPATILSRCQEFHFRRVGPALLTEYLRQIADSEELEASDTSLRLVARAGEGSIRDSIALLDQLATFGSGRIPEEEVARILGGVETAVHWRLLAATLAGEGDDIVRVVGEIDREGWDPRKVYSQFLGYCRDALHLSLGAKVGEIDLPEADAEDLRSLVSGEGYENLLRLLHQLLGSEASVRRSESASLALEIALLRAAELPKLTHIEQILGGGSPPGKPEKSTKPESGAVPPSREASSTSTPRSAAPIASPPAVSARVVATPPETAPPVAETPPARSLQSTSAPTAPPSSRPSEPVRAEDNRISSEPAVDDSPRADAGEAEPSKEGFLSLVSRRRQALAAHLGGAERVHFENGLLQIYTEPGDNWLRNALGRSNNQQILETCLAETWGESSRWTIVEKASVAEDEVPRSDASEPDPVLQHPFVQTALEVFGGSARALDDD